MKQIIITLALLSFLGVKSQERFAISNYTEPHHYFNDGFNWGFSIEYQMEELMYFKAQTILFPDLNGIDYYDVSGIVGFHHRSDFNNWRHYVGAGLGVVNRQGWGHPKVTIEGGIDYWFNSGIYVGYMAFFDYRTDGRAWETDAQDYWCFNNGLRFGIWW